MLESNTNQNEWEKLPFSTAPSLKSETTAQWNLKSINMPTIVQDVIPQELLMVH